MSKLDAFYEKMISKPSKRTRVDVAAQVETIMRDTRSRIERLAEEYRESVMLPICRKLGLTYVAGMGRTIFTPLSDPNRSIDQASEATGKYKALVPVFRQLNVEISHNDVFGYYVADIKEDDLR